MLYTLRERFNKARTLHDESKRLMYLLHRELDRVDGEARSDKLRRVISRVACRNRRRYTNVLQTREAVRVYEGSLRNSYVEDWVI